MQQHDEHEAGYSCRAGILGDLRKERAELAAGDRLREFLRNPLLWAALAGLLPVAGGEVLLQGRPLAAWPARERARQLAWLSQQGEAEGDIAVADVVLLGRLPHQAWLAPASAATA